MRVRLNAAYAVVLWSCVRAVCVWFAYVRMCLRARARVCASILACLVVLVIVRVIVCGFGEGTCNVQLRIRICLIVSRLCMCDKVFQCDVRCYVCAVCGCA